MRSLHLSALLLVGLATGLAVPAAGSPPVTHFDAEQVAAAFQTGAVLFNGAGANYMVHASRREAPGQCEIHSRDTDIIYVLDGATTFVTGGTCIDPKPTAPGEIRGTAVQNGDARRLVKGDVIIVPSNTPHWFSDPNDNLIYRWTPDGELSVYRTKRGYTGTDIGTYRQPGSNGLTLDRDGRLIINQHGNRRVIRLERNGEETVLADRYQGKRLNSPNDLVYKSDGTLYFTDPPFGLPNVFEDARKELPFSGVFRVGADGRVQLVARDLSGPNGLAFSPDERFLYVGNWDEKKKVIMRYPVNTDGTLGDGQVFFDMTAAPRRGRARWSQGRSARQRLCLWAGWPVDPVSRRQAPRNHRWPGASAQPRLG